LVVEPIATVVLSTAVVARESGRSSIPEQS